MKSNVHKLRTMSFMELAVFAEVARTGGVSAAAETLGLAKSGVSTLLKRFEQRLGLKLLERSSRRVALTREGELLLTKVESLLTECEQLFQEAELGRKRPQGTVRIAATPEFGSMAIGCLLPEVRARYPDIKLLVKLAYDREDLQDPSFDFAIRIGQLVDENLVARKLGTSYRLLVANPAFAKRYRIRKLADITEVPCLTFSSNSLEVGWKFYDRQSHEEQAVVVSSHYGVQSLSTVLNLCMLGEGAAVLPEFLVREHLASGQLVNLLPNLRSNVIDVNLVYRSGMQGISRVNAVLEIAREVLPALLTS